MWPGPIFGFLSTLRRCGQPLATLLAASLRYPMFRRPRPSPADPPPQTEERQGFFKRLRAKLNRGNSWLTYDLADLVRGRKIDAQILEELESRLLMADVGVEATEHILAGLRKRVARNELADVPALIAALRAAIVEILAPCARPL